MNAMRPDPGIPIDMVFTWVDGADAAHVQERRRYEMRCADEDAASFLRPDGLPEARFEQVGEIAASVNSA